MSRYDEAHWFQEIYLSQFGGALKCPSCHTLGFYNPRRGEQDGKPRLYRACKFCGFWQEAKGSVFDQYGGEPYRCRIFHCPDCSTDASRYPFGHYDWRLPLETSLICACGRVMDEAQPVATSGPTFPNRKALILTSWT
jgi:hypothetical protein